MQKHTQTTYTIMKWNYCVFIDKLDKNIDNAIEIVRNK